MTPSSFTFRGSSEARAAHADFRAELGETPDVAAGHAAVEDVPADGDLEAVQAAESDPAG